MPVQGEMSNKRRAESSASRRLIGISGMAIVLTLVTSCTWFGAVEPERIAITNETSATLAIYLEVGGEDKLIWTGLEPGQTTTLNECTQGDLIARREDGEAVDRRASPLCPPDQWRIE